MAFDEESASLLYGPNSFTESAVEMSITNGTSYRTNPLEPLPLHEPEGSSVYPRLLMGVFVLGIGLLFGIEAFWNPGSVEDRSLPPANETLSRYADSMASPHPTHVVETLANLVDIPDDFVDDLVDARENLAGLLIANEPLEAQSESFLLDLSSQMDDFVTQLLGEDGAEETLYGTAGLAMTRSQVATWRVDISHALMRLQCAQGQQASCEDTREVLRDKLEHLQASLVDLYQTLREKRELTHCQSHCNEGGCSSFALDKWLWNSRESVTPMCTSPFGFMNFEMDPHCYESHEGQSCATTSDFHLASAEAESHADDVWFAKVDEWWTGLGMHILEVDLQSILDDMEDENLLQPCDDAAACQAQINLFEAP